SWGSPTSPRPMENNPRVVFERLFGDSGTTDPKVRAVRRHQDKSVLDSVNGRLRELSRKLGTEDKRKLDDYTEAIRSVEGRIQRAELQEETELPVIAQPSGIPTVFSDHCKLMFDLQVLAY